MFYLRGTLGFSSINKQFVYENNVWNEGLKTGLAIGEISAGYPLYESSDFKIVPFAGAGLIEFSSNEKDDKYNDYSFHKITGVFGLNIDYKFGKSFALLNYFIFREKNNWVIRARFSCAPYSFTDNIKGWTFNLTVGIGGFLKIIHL